MEDTQVRIEGKAYKYIKSVAKRENRTIKTTISIIIEEHKKWIKQN